MSHDVPRFMRRRKIRALDRHEKTERQKERTALERMKDKIEAELRRRKERRAEK